MIAIRIPRRNSLELVDAELHNDLSVDDLLLAERSWTVERAAIMAQLRRHAVPTSEWPESLHWNWSAKAAELLLISATQHGVFCEGRWQALMMTKTVPSTARLPPDTGKPIVYVDFVETAPWNWRVSAISQDRAFLALGATMIRAAVFQSRKEGFRGRVGLHSLRQSELFYTSIGMNRVGVDSNKQRLAYFEFTRENAERFLTKRKSL